MYGENIAKTKENFYHKELAFANYLIFLTEKFILFLYFLISYNCFITIFYAFLGSPTAYDWSIKFILLEFQSK